MTKTYTLQHEVAIELDHCYGGLTLARIDPSNADERLLICGPNGDDGEYLCWDAVVEIQDGKIICDGSSSPGGMSEEIQLIVPLKLATKFHVDAAPFGMIDLNEYGVEKFLTEGLDCA
ncbi:hypothetical protein VN12_26710 [Pirellula sp. SH-Sr6A]|uniref:hypothetical protein n=1 Tax=Pirellula sp. SH-Sr6A TaxID=1632865 RepID=UPI00078E99DB|nr:hypothetical protein [Pirellula sp. SH-Sr6A]AMV35713.1 hypothetical protein VN12_26710 [Pirellula sp. SH-Sr6A]